MNRWRRTLALAGAGVLLLGGSWALRRHRDGGAWPDWPRAPVQQIAPEQGRAFTAPLPAAAPTSDPRPAPAVLLEDGVPIGGPALHDEIRASGAGRFSLWHGTLYFSSSDGTDPRSNGRRYEVAWPSATWSRVEWGTRWGGWLALALAGLGALGRLGVRRRLLARLALVPASALLALAAVEVGMRIRYPFADSNWPGRFDARFGFAFEPGASVRQTNLYDFCVEQRANSLGFLDREPPARREPGTSRVVFLGDSFVEAVQVPIADKVHVVLEQRLADRGVRAHIAAFGMSGCGTSNELAFYETFGACRAGDLVVLIVVANDFANNSALLEALRNGWDPAHPPRLFFAPEQGTFRRLPIDPDWKSHLLPSPPLTNTVAAPESWLAWSRTWRWVEATQVAMAGSKVTDHGRTVRFRLDTLSADPAVAAKFAEWRCPDDGDLDSWTKVVAAPPAFREAVATTEFALSELARRVAADGARLLVVACHNLGAQSAAPAGHEFHAGSWLGLLQPMCERLGLPLLDLHARFAERGVLDRVTFVRDGHWNTLGHAEAAAAIDDLLQQRPELLGGR